MARIYTYPNQPNVYAIDIDNKILNLVLNYHGTKPSSYITGGIVQFAGPMDEIEFPDNILMDNYPTTYIGTTLLYDTWTTTDEKVFQYNGAELNIDKLDVVEPAETQINDALIKTIKEIETHFEKLKRLFNRVDLVLQHQWFMDYVDFSEFKDMHVTDENREIEITKIIRTIHKLSTQFQINNNHQMKLFFQIFLNLKDTGETSGNEEAAEAAEAPAASAAPAAVVAPVAAAPVVAAEEAAPVEEAPVEEATKKFAKQFAQEQDPINMK